MTISPRATDSARHIASPFPEHRAELGHQVRFLVDLGAQRTGPLGGAVLRRRVDHQHLVDEVQPGERLHDRADGVRHLARG